MRFALSEDQRLLQQAARGVLARRCPADAVRRLWDEPGGTSEALWGEMAALGWLGLALPEAAGGAGLGLVETAVIQEELGRVACPGPYLPTVLAGRAVARAGPAEQRERWLPRIAAGQARGTVALLDEDGLGWAPGAVATRATTRAGRWTLAGAKRFVPWAHVADLVVVPGRSRAGVGAFLVEPGRPGVAVEPQPALDGGTRWATVKLDGAAAEPLGPADGGPALLGGLLRWGAVGAAAEMLGAARRCLELSVAHAKVREQFGQPIGSYQAIRHKCAEMLRDVEGAHAAVYYAAWALDAGAEDAPVAASVAKAYVSEAAWAVCGEALQVHGGIGFTWEHELHLYAKRTRALGALYGDAGYHRELLAGHLLAGAGPPAP